MKVRTILYPNGGERRGHTLMQEWPMPDAHFPGSMDEAKQRSIKAMRHWLGVDPTPLTQGTSSLTHDEYVIEGRNWKVEWRKGGAVQRHADEVAALQAGDNDSYWRALGARQQAMGGPLL